MSFTEKVDVLDLLISILREHEDKLDELVTRLEKLPEAAKLIRDIDTMKRAYSPLDKKEWR